METGDALRVTSDALLRDLDVLITIEEEKRTLEPGDPRLVDLAARIEDIAQRVLAGTSRQHQLTKLVNAQVDAGDAGAPSATIDETVRPVSAILADWREAERVASLAAPGSAEQAQASSMAARFREEYRRAFDAAREVNGS
jgi:hypothetical protein